MAWVESMQKAIDFMETHLLEPIKVEDIAMQAHVPPFHFQRLFVLLTDVSLGVYIRGRRMALAAKELVRSDCTIIDLSYTYGYDTPEAFPNAFLKHHGMTSRGSRRGASRW